MGPEIWIFIVFVAILIAILLLIVSMDTISPLHYGITYNSITKYVGEEVYENGRYIIGPLNSFIVYPGYLVNMEFSTAKNSDV